MNNQQPSKAAIRQFRLASAFSLGIVIFLTLVGGIVRSTGSGMGCPDWPKCFGYKLPPSEISQLTYQEGKSFRKGNMVIHEEALWKAKKDFTAQGAFSENEWEKYTKHDYAVFNPAHTWTEFLNRIVGVLTGLMIFWMFIASLPYRKSQIGVTIFSFLSLILVMFEGWLGKLVVDSNLKEGMITIHMVGAMLTLFTIITARILTFPLRYKTDAPISFSKQIQLGGVTSLLILIQIALGTQVREKVDVVAKTLGDSQRSEWLNNLGSIYNYHTSFYLLILIIMGFWIVQLRQIFPIPRVKSFSIAIILLLFSEILVGMVLNLMNIPPIAQPVHLLLATLLFSISYWLTALLMTAKRLE